MKGESCGLGGVMLAGGWVVEGVVPFGVEDTCTSLPPRLNQAFHPLDVLGFLLWTRSFQCCLTMIVH